MRNVTNVLLDELRKANGIGSDYALAKVLDVGVTTISNYRNNRSQLSDEIALRVAAALNRPAAPILAELAAERAKHPEVAKVWREAAKTLSRKRS